MPLTVIKYSLHTFSQPLDMFNSSILWCGPLQYILVLLWWMCMPSRAHGRPLNHEVSPSTEALYTFWFVSPCVRQMLHKQTKLWAAGKVCDWIVLLNTTKILLCKLSAESISERFCFCGVRSEASVRMTVSVAISQTVCPPYGRGSAPHRANR